MRGARSRLRFAADLLPRCAWRSRPGALEYFRQVERTGKELIITDRGRPVLKVAPYGSRPADAVAALRGSVLRYDDPLEPVDRESWEAET